MKSDQRTTTTVAPKVSVISNRVHSPYPQTENPVITNVDAPVKREAPPVTTNSIVKSRKRTSLDEFAHRIHLRPEIKAGFKAWLRGQYFAFDNEWEQLYNDYTNRKI